MQEVLTRFVDSLDHSPVRTWSLIVTIYGDCVMPRGGELWLGTLTDLLAALDVEPGSTRTAMSRLARDGFLRRKRVGRTSHYALSEPAIAVSHEAETVIYRTRAPHAAPGWDLVVALPPHRPDRKALIEAGYESASPGLFVRPRRTDGAAQPANAIHLHAAGDDDALARAVYPLDDIAARYHAFIRASEGLSRHAHDAGPLEALAIRVMLVHAFRRIALRDPHLSSTALPADWPADEAYKAFSTLYLVLRPLSETWLDANGQNASGPLPAPDIAHRFADTGNGRANADV
nr:PaaX family transcriptional regulator C-terminal domain-containing protein [Acuticoccus kalidii]